MQHAHHQYQYAGLLRRVLAFALDNMMLSLLGSALVITIFGLDSLHSAQQGGLNWPSLMFNQALPLIWAIGFWLLWMATPGKHLVDCRLADARTLGPVPAKRLVLRYLGYILSALPLGLGFLWIAFDRRKQGWHDKLAGTVVIMQDASLAPLEAYR